ncbi:hypothetical protein [Streptomyces coffeae]|uniref:Uncharacterized protein n=1 Tax=Streptomyces coffeae TaxID=621382 RepID=A0ABS1NE62_9ACTN|nr:hypothetical protein [Streptomyces coffeae]
MFDVVALSGTTEDRVIENVDHLHEHVTDPVIMKDGHNAAPTLPGFSSEMRAASIDTYRYPDGGFRTTDRAARAVSGRMEIHR